MTIKRVHVSTTFNSHNNDDSLNPTGTSSELVIARKYSSIDQGFILNSATTETVILKDSKKAYYKEENPLTQFERITHNKISNANDFIHEASYFKQNH